MRLQLAAAAAILNRAMPTRRRNAILALCTLLTLLSGVSSAHAPQPPLSQDSSGERSGTPPTPIDHSAPCGGGPAEPSSDGSEGPSMPCCDPGYCACPIGTVSAVASLADTIVMPRPARVGEPPPPAHAGTAPQRLLRPPIR